MSVPMVDLKTQYKKHKAEIDSAIQQVVDNTAFILGDKAKQFEESFASYCGAKHCVGVGNGTDAIAMALQAVGVEQGDEVITTPWTFIATVEAICERGAIPRFVDIDPVSYCIDTSSDAAKIADVVTEKTKAIVPVHIYGQICEMQPIMKLARLKGLKVVEDAAQAHGAEIDGVRAGCYADAATFSFFPGKNLGAFGDAGGIVTNNEDVAAGLRMLRNHGQKVKYTNEVLGRNSRLDGIQAAVLSVKLKYLDEWTRRRRHLAKTYSDALTDIASGIGIEVITPHISDDPRYSNSHAFHLYTIRVPKRDEFAAYLREQGIACAIHYPRALHEQQALAHLNIAKGSFPEAEKAGREVISLPLCPELTPDNQQRVIEAFKQFYSK